MNTDSDGNKIAEKKISKVVMSKNIRNKRVTAGHLNIAFCNKCGFRVRGAGHLTGQHHIQNTKLEN